MKKTTYTSFLDGAVWNLLKNASIPLLVTLLLISSTQLGAQCAMSCFDIQVSLDEDCQATITQDMVSDVGPDCFGPFTVQLFDPYGDLIPTSPVVTGAYLGQTLTVGVIDQWSGNNCWSTALVEDKMPPFSLCNDITMGCWELGEYPGPFFFDNCSIDQVDVEQIGQEVVIDMNCDPNYVRKIIRTWEGTDDWGNSSTCEQTITLERIDTSLLDFPAGRTINGGNPISCDAPYDLDGDGVIDPSYAGVPTLDGDPLYPLPDIYCNILVSFVDQPFPPLNCVDKVMRLWTFREWWCGDEIIITMPQILEIVDETPPNITCPADFTVTTDPQDCSTTLFLPPATVTDNCNAISHVDVTYPGGFNPFTNGGYATLGVGVNTVVYTAYDACYTINGSSSCEMSVTVIDDTPPIAVCDLHTAVSLTNNGTARVYAETFDDGSHDECYVDSFQVRRMDPGCGYLNTWGPYVEFSCCDIDFNPIMVVMRVWDHSNNYNDCMVEVQVQDKLPAYITCPPNFTISCEFPYDMNDLFVFGDVVEADDPNDIGNPLLDPRDSIVFDDPGNPNTSGPAYYGMDGYAYDNCQVTITHSSQEVLDQCGEGSILRYFTADGPGGLPKTCVQTITVYNFDHFYVNEDDPDDPYDDIEWPDDITIDAGCEPQDYDPSVTGAPIVDEDACDLVGISEPDDWVFDFNEPGDPACFKILRKWKVIDWCSEPVNGQYTIYQHQQIIKVINTSPPEITAGCDDVSVCSYDPECVETFINLTIVATDDCTDPEDLDIDYDIDAYNDGIFDFNENYNPYADINNGINQASGRYPVGTHRIVWRVEDRCGNFVTCEYLFEIVNCKKPTPVCINGLAAELMPMDLDSNGVADWAMIELKPWYFDAGSNHPCYDDITLSFSETLWDTSMWFDCTHIGEQYVELWAHAPNGTADYCATFVDIQDNNGVCPDTGPITGNISGTITTPFDLKVSAVSVELSGNGQTASAGHPAMTNTEGQYSFDMPYGGNYTVMPEKDDDVLNGVTTLDLALIQRHILGLEIFDEPAEWIAGDIDHNELIDILDLVELRRVILGVQDEFMNNKSWRFVDGNYAFTSDDPLTEEFPEEYHIPVFTQDMMDVDFNGIKIGDINRSADLDGANSADDRSREVFALSIPVIDVQAGQTVNIPVFSSEMVSLMSLQFTMAFDPATVEIVSVEGKALELSDANTGWSLTDRGMLTFSWNESEFQTLTDAEELFELTVRSLVDQQSGDMISVNGEATSMEAYTTAGIMDVDLTARNSEEIDAVFTVYQNRPNPFSNVTSIGFNLPQSGSVTLTILDLTGKTIRVIEQEYAKGYHEIEVKASDLHASGVLYYRLDADGYSATKKMIITE